MARSKKYKDYLMEELKDRNEAIAYLNATLEESLINDPESKYLCLSALRDVVEAQGGIRKLARKANGGYEGLEEIFSSNCNITWHTFVLLCNAAGFRLYVK